MCLGVCVYAFVASDLRTNLFLNEFKKKNIFISVLVLCILDLLTDPKNLFLR